MTIQIKSATATQVVLQLASQNQEELKKVSSQIASGDKHPDFKGYAEDGTVERLISFSATVAYTKNYVTTNNNTIARINAQDQAVAQLQTIASDLAQLIAQRRNSASGSDVPVDIMGTSMLDNIASNLNVKFDGRYLFSGTKTNTMPFPDAQATNLDEDDNPTANYYAGNSEIPSTKINDSEETEYGVLGNDIGIQQLIGAVHLAINGHNANDDTKLAAAMEMVNQSISNIASSRSILLSAKVNINNSNSSLNSVNLLISENLVGISQTDIVDATTRMSELQATIQATYLAFNKLTQLRLSNFLN